MAAAVSLHEHTHAFHPLPHSVLRAPAALPGGKERDVHTVEFSLLGTPCVGLNGPPIFKHSEAFSFQVQTGTQEETDRLWNAITGNGGQDRKSTRLKSSH